MEEQHPYRVDPGPIPRRVLGSRIVRILFLAASGVTIAAMIGFFWYVNPYQREALTYVWELTRGVDQTGRLSSTLGVTVPNSPDAGTVRWPGYDRFCLGTTHAPGAC